MPRELAQLLLDEGVVGPDGVEQALARQREAGGALDTALLELGLVGEEQLVGLLSRASDLPAAPLSVYEAVDARARRVFPSKVAERHGLAPFAIDGRELSLVATCPLDLGLLDEISFMLSLHLSPHVGPEWRVRSLIQRLYGGPLPPRLARLAEAAGGPVEVRSAAPPPPAAEAPPPGPPAPPAAPPARPPPQRPAGFTGFRGAGDEPLEPLAAALAQAAEAFELDWEAEALATPLPEVPPPAGGAEAPPEAEADAAAAQAAAEPPPEPPPPPRELDRSAPPRWTVAAARAVLDGAVSRDEIVLAALRYARDFFQYAALFAVTRDAVAGHDALGVEDGAREVVRTVALYVSDPGIFRTSLDTLAPYLGPVARDAAGSAAVLDGLGRGAPRTALVYPILLRGRPICILYADNGQAPVSARRLGDLLLVLSLVGGAFERIIKARKGGRPYPPPAWTRPLAEAPPASPGPDLALGPAPEEPASAVALPPAPEEPAPAVAPAPAQDEPPEAPRPSEPPPVEPAAQAWTAPEAPVPLEAEAPALPEDAAPGWQDGPAVTDVPPAVLAPTDGEAADLAAPPAEPPPEQAPAEVLAPQVAALATDAPPEVEAAFAEPPPLPPEPAQEPPPAPAPDLADVEEAFFSSPPGLAPVGLPVAPPVAPPPPLNVPAPLPQEVSVSLELTLERPLEPPAPTPSTDEAPPGEVSIALELTGERPLAAAPPPSSPPPEPVPESAAPPAPGAPPEVPPEVAAAFPELPGLPEAALTAAAAPPAEAPAPAPSAAEITLERPLPKVRPIAPVDPAALVGTYLVSPRGSDDRADLLARLVDRAAEVAPILCDQLPGPLDVPAEALSATPAADQGPVLAAVAALGPAAGKALLAMLPDPAAARRRAAVALLGQLGDPATFLPLAERCFDPDPAVAEAARAALALHRRDPGMKPVPEKLRRALLSGLADKAAAAARAIAALRDAESIPLLIQALEGSDAGTAAASADALAAITLQRHGTKARDWLMWWKQNRGRQRTEWLFGALTSGDRELRLLAATELREAAASPVSYSADLPEAERLAAAQAWQRWFQKGGHRL